MIHMYAGRAEIMAIEHANGLRRLGEIPDCERWIRIAELIRKTLARRNSNRQIPRRSKP